MSRRLVDRAVSGADPWRLGNQVLYDLCRTYRRHDEDAEIIAKVWLIGRAYSASIERGRGQASSAQLSNDRFYSDEVPKALRSCGLDTKLSALRKRKEPDEFSSAAALDAQTCLLATFRRLTNKEKRSLASKYLHFHCPQSVFIYDSRALASIRACRVEPVRLEFESADREYARFVGAALALRNRVLEQFDTALTPRQLDRLLLALHEERV